MNNKDKIDDDFSLLYQKLHNQYFPILERLEKTETIKGYINFFLIFILPILLVLFGKDLLISIHLNTTIGYICILAIYIAVLIYILKPKKGNKKDEFSEIFNEHIIPPIVKCALPKSQYYPYDGIKEEEYSKGKWEKFVSFCSGRKIVTPISINNTDINLQLSEAFTEAFIGGLGVDGYGEIGIQFEGIIGFINLPKNINGFIRLVKNKSKLIENKENKLDLDYQEFNEKFDVETNNESNALKIFSKGFMIKLLEFVNNSKMGLEFYVCNDNLYIRFECDEMLFKSEFKERSLKNGYNKLKSITNIVEYICNILIENS